MNAEAVAEGEVAELRQRLAEAEETIRAIREGEVDALVVRGGRNDDEVFTLEGGVESYRAFMETMDTGASAIDREGRVLYANHALCQLIGKTLEQLQGRRLSAAFDSAAATDMELLVANAKLGKQSIEIRAPRETGEAVLMASIAPLTIGLTSGYAVTMADITDRLRAAATVESGRAARAIIASANEAVVVCDLEGVVTEANAAATGVFDGDLIGRRFSEAVPLTFPGATGLLQTEDLIEMVIAGNGVQGLEAMAANAPRSKDYLISAAPLHFAGDKPNGCVVTMVDLSQRKAAEKQQLLLMAELDHRVKNTLALVLSISSRTASNEETLPGYQKAFTGRIQALAATHTILAEKSWKDLSIAAVVRAELQPYAEVSDGRIELQGLDLSVTPRAAIALGLIFHELTTNAAKYGALSAPEGHVVVHAVPSAEGSLLLEWTETGGPPVSEPSRRGFGRTVISRSLQYSPDGGADLEFRPSGLYCAIRVPREDLVA